MPEAEVQTATKLYRQNYKELQAYLTEPLHAD